MSPALPTPPPDPERDAALHKLGDRLTVAVGFGDLLLSGAYGTLSDEQRRAVETIVGESRQAVDLLRYLVRGGLGR